MQKNVIFILFLSVIVALFAILNAKAVPVNFLFVKVEVSVALVILISACLGATIVYLIGSIAKFKSSKKIKGLENTIKDQEKNVGNLNTEIKNLHEKMQNLGSQDKEDPGAPAPK